MSVFPWLPPEDRTVHVDTAESDFDTVLAVYRLPEGLSPTFDNLVLIGCVTTVDQGQRRASTCPSTSMTACTSRWRGMTRPSDSFGSTWT